MRSNRLIGIGISALSAAALLGSGFTATAYAEGHGNGDDKGYNGARNDHGDDELRLRIVTVNGVADSEPVTAYCPRGGRVTGGGVQIVGELGVFDDVQGTYPTQQGDGWVGVADAYPSNTPITVYAVCVKDDHGYHD